MATALAHSRAYIAPASPGLSARDVAPSRPREVAFTPMAKGQKVSARLCNRAPARSRSTRAASSPR